MLWTDGQKDEVKTKHWDQHQHNLKVAINLHLMRLISSCLMLRLMSSPNNFDDPAHNDGVDEHDDGCGQDQEVVAVSPLHPAECVLMEILDGGVRTNHSHGTKPSQETKIVDNVGGKDHGLNED